MATQGPQHPRPSNRTFATVDLSTAADGVSDSVNITGLKLSCISMSTVGWTSANIGFQGSVDGSTNFLNVYTSSGDFLTFQTSASRIVTFDPALFAGLQLIKLVSETSAGVATAQAAVRTLKLGLSEG